MMERTTWHDNAPVAPSIKYLLPITRPTPNDVDTPTPLEDDKAEGPDEMVQLYHQAIPLVHPHSTATIRTIESMFRDRTLGRRMIQHTQQAVQCAMNGDGSHDRQPSINSSSCSPSGQSLRLPIAAEFLDHCRHMFASFARRVGDTSDLKLSKLRLLLRQHELEVDDTLYRQWEQTLPEGAHTITFPQFVHACHQLYGQKALVAHFNTRVWDGNTLVKSQSAPQLHPFDLLEQKNEDALAFNYEDYLQRPMPAKKTDDERLRHKQSRLIQATQELRRKTKLLHGLNLAMPGSKDSDSSSVSPQHERLHQEKLAHHILKRGSILALAPANRAKVVSSSLLQREKVMKQKTKDVRQHHIETAKAFASSVAMISRHVQHEEFKDLCDSQLEEQFARVDEQKRLNRVHKAHCHALAADKQQQQLREVQAMKTIAKEELQMVKKYVQLRQEMAKLTHGKPFTLSPSSSTLFQQPPELMAARATAKGGSQKKKLRELEKEYLEHARSIQLLDYVYDRRRAAMMSTKPKAEAALVDVELTDLPDDRAEKLATQELWEQLLEELKVDMSQFIPSANSPPAALKYYGTSRPVILPPFSSSVERKTM